MVFFVVSTFRDFVIRDIFLFRFVLFIIVVINIRTKWSLIYAHPCYIHCE